jgi:predicted  nucleic acid-binding Zn-ribbon protein
MSEIETTVAERLKQLFKLQNIDSELDEIEVLKGELPMEVNDLEDEVAGLNTRLSKLQDQLTELKEEISAHNAQISESEALVERYKKQMDEVKNNREYEALTKEMEGQSLEIQLSQKKIGKLTTELESRQETFEATKERIATRQADLKVKSEELDNIIAKTEKEEKALRKKSDAERKKLEDRLLLAYDRIRGTYRNRMAVVQIKRSSCGGCFNYIPPQQQLEIGLHKKVIACEHCGRILVDDTIVQEIAPHMLDSVEA